MALDPIREPRQARSRATWARMLDAGVELLEEGGYEALTIGALCRRTGTTPPTVYARAGNKEGLLLAVLEHAQARLTRDSIDADDPAWEGLSPSETADRAVAAVGRVLLSNARLLRPIVHRAVHDPETFRRGSENSRADAVAFRVVLGRVGVDPAQADLCYRIVYAAFVQRVMYGGDFESDLPLSDEALVAGLSDVVRRQIAG